MKKEEFKKQINELLGKVETIDDLNSFLDNNVHQSDLYIVITEVVEKNLAMKKIINDAKNADNKASYQLYQHIKMTAKKIHEHDMASARNIDVDMAVTRAYTILLKMIGSLNQTVIKQCEAINKIEEHLGLSITQFGDDENDSTRNSDVQRIEKDSK